MKCETVARDLNGKISMLLQTTIFDPYTLKSARDDCHHLLLMFLARSSRQEAAAEGRIDSRACVVNMCVLGEVMFSEKFSISFNRFSVFHSFKVRFLSISFNSL